MMKHKTVTFIDLFCGCGGFSKGLEQAGLECLAGVDSNQFAIETFRLNHIQKASALVKDMTIFNPNELAEIINTHEVDLIIGGPPCQGFSTARQSSGSNSGSRLIEDSRRELYKTFLDFVKYFKPKVFVIENVLGIKKSQNGIYFTKIQDEARKIGYRVSAIQVNAWEYGVPQKRMRQLFIGTLTDLPIFVPDFFIKKTHSDNPNNPTLLPLVTLGEAIEDLPKLKAGDERIEQKYDVKLREKYFKKYSGKFLQEVLDINNSTKLTWHCSRPHSERDLRDFARLREGETCGRALARGVEMEFPYNKESFKDRYTRQSRKGLCSTIVAHMRADGLMFIHPTQTRSLTPREAARIQSFPDTFQFSGSRTHVFVQIGNAVPPLIGKAVGNGITEYLCLSNKKSPVAQISLIKRKELIAQLEAFVNKCYIISIDLIQNKEFLEIWSLIHQLLPNLHPASISDNGNEISQTPHRSVSFCLEPYFLRSGWPVELLPIALEAQKRFKIEKISSSDYFHF